MITPKTFLETLHNQGVDFFTGVPDSLLKDVCLCIDENVTKEKHIITANEGASIGLATGHYLATGNIPLVYMQNSGLGNCINPLTSLADKDVYSIPMLLLIGWRGEPGISDEPQHKKMGRVTLDVLDAIGVQYFVLPDNFIDTETIIINAIKLSIEKKCPIALIIKKDTFSKYTPIAIEDKCSFVMTRERAVEVILEKSDSDDVFVSTTGKLSRELFELREKNNQSHDRDFLTVGSMGHASQIALGISLENTKRILCLDGDGAFIMHMGSLVINGTHAPKNFLHIVLNNGCHESVGGQPTEGFNINMPKIAEACGYKNFITVDDEQSLVNALENFSKSNGPSFIEIRIGKNSRSDLGRPTKTPIENKNAFMNFLKK